MPICQVCGEDVPEAPVGQPFMNGCFWNAYGYFQYRANAVYIEGWAVRRRNGQLEPFQHAWVVEDGQVVDNTPHNHAEAHFSALEFAHGALQQLGLTVPAYRDLTCPHNGEAINPRYDGKHAERFALAKQAADAYCAEH